MRHGSLFSGIGGFDLAAEWAGWTNVFHCEINPFCQKVLNYYWPNAESLNNIKNTDFSKYNGAIDIISGGFPCQPYSMAGKRLGKEDDRHLWPEMLRAIREIRPRWVVGENVRGLINWSDGLVFDEVHTDLENEGYEVRAFILPAASVNAPHRRDRIWFVAYANNSGGGSELGQVSKEDGKVSEWNENAEFGNAGSGPTSNTDVTRLQEWWENGGQQHSAKNKTELHNRIEQPCDNGPTSNTEGNRNSGGLRQMERADGCIWQSEKHGENYTEFSDNGERQPTPNANSNKRPEGRMHETRREKAERHLGAFDARGNGRTAWENFPTQSPVCCGDDGLPTELDGVTFSRWRKESLKAYGNAVVPQVVFEIFSAINEYEIVVPLANFHTPNHHL